MANHMAEVAKMLGVELGEIFSIKSSSDDELMGIALLESKGLHLLEYNETYTFCWHPYALENLLTGIFYIERKPWKPKDDEKYWRVYPDGEVLGCCWCNTAGGNACYKLGNCYRTREEAEANRDKWVAFYASDEVLEV